MGSCWNHFGIILLVHTPFRAHPPRSRTQNIPKRRSGTPAASHLRSRTHPKSRTRSGRVLGRSRGPLGQGARLPYRHTIQAHHTDTQYKLTVPTHNTSLPHRHTIQAYRTDTQYKLTVPTHSTSLPYLHIIQAYRTDFVTYPDF